MAANQIEQSESAAGGGTCSEFSDFLAAIRQQDFQHDILPAWKQTFRRQKSDFVKHQHDLALMSWEEEDQKAHKRKQSNAAAGLQQSNNKRKQSEKTATKATTKKTPKKSATQAATKKAQKRTEETAVVGERPGLLPAWPSLEQLLWMDQQ